MKCPIDTAVDLVMSERNGIEIDYCPTCRGVWLDRGELDKIIDRAAAPYAGQTSPPMPMPTSMPTASPATIASADDRRWKRDRDDDDRHHDRNHDDRSRHEHHDHYDRDDSDGYARPKRKKKREGFLGDLFDF